MITTRTTAIEGAGETGPIRLRELADRMELAELVARQGRWLDERRFDEAGSVFTDDATVVTQGGRSEGLRALVAQARRVHGRFAATQHAISNVLIDLDLDGDRAAVRADLIVTFVQDDADPRPTAMLGERYRWDAVRTPAGWRFRRVEAIPVWRSGEISPPD